MDYYGEWKTGYWKIAGRDEEIRYVLCIWCYWQSIKVFVVLVSEL